MKRSIFTSLTLAIFIFTGIVWAQPGNFGQGHPMGPQMQKMNQLQLSEKQQTKMDGLRLDFQKQILPLRSELQVLKTAYKLMVIDDKVSESKLKAQLQKISAKRQEIALMRVKHTRQIRSLLTADQKTKFDQHYLSSKKRNGRKAGRMHKRPGMSRMSNRMH